MRGGQGPADSIELDAVLTWAEGLREENAGLAARVARLRAERAGADRRAFAIGLAAAVAFSAAGELTRRYFAMTEAQPAQPAPRASARAR